MPEREADIQVHVSPVGVLSSLVHVRTTCWKDSFQWMFLRNVGIPSNWTQTRHRLKEWTATMHVNRDQGHCDLNKHILGHNSRIHMLIYFLDMQIIKATPIYLLSEPVSADLWQSFSAKSSAAGACKASITSSATAWHCNLIMGDPLYHGFTCHVCHNTGT